MLSALHSFYKPICLTLFIFLGLACGHLVDTVLQVQLRPDLTTGPAVDRPAEIPSLKSTQADLNLILQNNLFDTDNRSAIATIDVGSSTGSDGEPATASARTDLKLFGTVVAGEQSQALLEVNGKLQLIHLGGDIPGDGALAEVRRNQVDIRNRNQSITTLVLHEKTPGTTASQPTNREPSAQNVKDNGEVRSVGENRWMVSHNMVESVRENIAEQLRLAQMQPRLVDGKTNGFIIQRINPRSILNKMGLQRGDVIIDVNNIQLDSPEKALQVFQQLREARQITVAVERDGQPMSLSYEIE